MIYNGNKTKEGFPWKHIILASIWKGRRAWSARPGEGLSYGSANAAFAAREVLQEANAAARALFDCGAQRVILWDNHGGGVNFDYHQVDPRCEIALGSFHTRFPGIDESFAGILFIGYHASASTKDAALSHTYSSKTYQYYRINGRDVGEMEIDAAFAGAMACRCCSLRPMRRARPRRGRALRALKPSP